MKKFYQCILFAVCLLAVPVCLPETAARAELFGGIVRYSRKTGTLTIPEGLDSIPPGALAYCMALNMKVAPGNRHFMVKDNVLFSADGSCLVYYLPLRKGRVYRIPDSVTRIAPMAFANSRNLRRVVLHENIRVLGAGAFFRCNFLEKINLHDAVKLREINDCHTRKPHGNGINDNYVTMPYEEYVRTGNSHSPLHSFYHGTFEGTRLTSVRLPDSVEYLAEETFRSCQLLRRITFGKRFVGGINTPEKDPGKTLLLYQLDLESLKFRGKNPAYRVRDDVLYSADGTVLCQVLYGRHMPADREMDFVVNSGVTQIADGAFYHMVCLESVTVEGSLSSIGRSAFYLCMTMQTFRAGGDIAYIGKGAFSYCGSLLSFICLGKVGTVDREAFLDAYQLLEAVAGGLPDFVDDTAFRECWALPVPEFTPLRPDRKTNS